MSAGVLRVPAFARLWVASLFSELAEWILQAALPVFVYQVTGSATSTATTMMLGLLPAVLLSPVAGVLADRYDRRLLLCAVCAGQALAALPLLAGSHQAVLYLVMAAQAGLAALFEPARTALVPELVGTERVTAANGLMGFNNSVARLLGASGGGLLLGFGGIGWVVAGYLAALAVAGLVLLAPFRGVARRQQAERRPMPREWLDGLAELRRNRTLRTTGAVVVLISVAQGMFLVLFVLFVLNRLGGGPAEVGTLRGTQAVGGLVAGVLLATLARKVPPGALLGWGCLALGVLSALAWNGPQVTTAFAVYLGLFTVIGAPAVAASSGLFGLLQTAAPPEVTGRVLATMSAVMAGCQALGMWLAGSLAGLLGLGGLLDIQAALHVLAGAVALRWLARTPGRTTTPVG